MNRRQGQNRDETTGHATRAISHRPVGSNSDGAGSTGLFPELRRALFSVLAERKRMDKVIEQTLHTRRRLWTDAERARFVETMHETVREWRWRWHLAGLPDAEFLEGITDERLRRVMRDQAQPSREKLPPAVKASFPDWLWTRAGAEIGVDWPRLAGVLAEPAPLFLRPNTLRHNQAKVAGLLAMSGIETSPGPADSLRVAGRRDVFATAAFHSGAFEVQDAGSQMISPLLEVAPGMRVLDACAGAGGKALHLAVLMRNKGRIIALDIHDWKLAELRRRATRAGADNIETRLAEGPKTTRRLAGAMDRVLLDVPCSGLGVLRRHPDRKWHLKPDELDRLTALQATLLREFAPVVKAGGKLLYATCSILPSENERQVRAFLAEKPEWKLEAEKNLRPAETGGDAFYAARLVRATKS
jgi:16S rRNA (cytosine967-C5)-methyltransferase